MSGDPSSVLLFILLLFIAFSHIVQRFKPHNSALFHWITLNNNAPLKTVLYPVMCWNASATLDWCGHNQRWIKMRQTFEYYLTKSDVWRLRLCLQVGNRWGIISGLIIIIIIICLLCCLGMRMWCPHTTDASVHLQKWSLYRIWKLGQREIRLMNIIMEKL